MPPEKRYSASEKRWTVKETEIPIDYDATANMASAILLEYWRMYPDRYAAFCEAEQPDYRLTFIQCVMIRSMGRYQENFITGGRGVTKSYVTLLSKMILGSLFPGIKVSYYGPTIKQTASIISSTFKAIQKNYPILASEWSVVCDAIERFTIRTEGGSQIDVAMMRGTNANCVVAEEVAQQEAGEQFDHEKFRSVVLPAVRVQRMIDGVVDENFPNFQKCYVTSAGRKQNEAYEYRRDILRDALEGRSAFEIDIPAEVAVLCGIRTIDWYRDMRRKLTPEEWLREMGARWSGTCENPVIRDSTLAESKTLPWMENRHCLDPNATYIIGYDVSYADGANRAKCATCVLKCEPQSAPNKAGRYMKSVVYVLDEPPPQDHIMQAKRLKSRWYNFCLNGGRPTYIVIDARSYGQSVLEDLHKDLGDGLPPLCCIEHNFPQMEQDGALPVIYPMAATGRTGDQNSDGDMLRYCELEWEQRNVRLLIGNINEGVQAYKRLHHIKDDILDPVIAIPYQKTRELAGQISNLKKEVSGAGMRERRISQAIQRDMWSATKYAMWMAKYLEHKEMLEGNRRTNEWQRYIQTGAKPEGKAMTEVERAMLGLRVGSQPGGRGIAHSGGNRRW